MSNKPIKTVLLIDDDDATNFLHKITIKHADCAEYVHIAINGLKALEYLTEAIEGKFPQPDLIFLDVNMPVMGGWEFLDAYEMLPKEQKAKMVLVMLTASLNPDDETKAKSYETVSGFKNKPLTIEMLHDIVKLHFS